MEDEDAYAESQHYLESFGVVPEWISPRHLDLSFSRSRPNAVERPDPSLELMMQLENVVLFEHGTSIFVLHGSEAVPPSCLPFITETLNQLRAHPIILPVVEDEHRPAPLEFGAHRHFPW